MNRGYLCRDLGVSYGPCPVLQSVNLDLPPGQLTSIVGPNGAGKSTLLSLLAGLHAPTRGSCLYDDIEVRHWSRRAFAQQVSYVPQSVAVPFPFTVEEVVSMSRTPFGSTWFETAADRHAVDQALARTGTAAFRHRDFRTLSGGERQRVVLAAALAQSPRVLLLDEPATYLDLSHQVQLAALLGELRGEGLQVVAVTHDLNLAARYSDRILVLHRGSIAADGEPAEVLTASLVEEVFGVPVELVGRSDGRPWLRYGA